MGITDVLFDKHALPQLEARGVDLASADFRAVVLSEEYEDETAMLYRVRQPVARTAAANHPTRNR
jgi:hypothetical protein